MATSCLSDYLCLTQAGRQNGGTNEESLQRNHVVSWLVNNYWSWLEFGSFLYDPYRVSLSTKTFVSSYVKTRLRLYTI